MPNRLPQAQNITVNGFEDKLSKIALSGSDRDGSVTGYILTSLPSNGVLYLDAAHTIPAVINTVYASKTFFFLPASNFNGTASFNYNVRDNQGGVSTSAALATIKVAAVNDAPVVDLNGSAAGTSAALAYAPGGAAARIAPSATVVDIDSSNFGGGSLRVAISQNKSASDQLTIATDASVTIFRGSVFVAGLKVGTLSGGSNGSDLVINLVAGATPSSVSTLVEHIAYSNSSANPPASPRTITFKLVDGDGTANGGTNTGLATAIINFDAGNHVPTGSVTIAGTATEDQVLTASNTLADADGLGTVGYQWQRNGVNIGGATGSTYTLGDADVGAAIRVVATYTDGHGTIELKASTATGPVANVNDAPTGAVTIAGIATEDQVLSAANTLADADGIPGAISYQWQRNTGSGFVNIGGATGSTYQLGDADVGATIQIVASYIDGQGTTETVTSAPTAAISATNDPHTGSVTISGSATEDQVLTAEASGLADADGLGTFAYQWLRDGIAIDGAMDATYQLGDADVGTAVSVSVSYIDGQGFAENSTSAATAAVLQVINGSAVDGYIAGALVFSDANENGVYDSGETFTTTDVAGNFLLVGGSGPLVLSGGVDISTNLSFAGVLRAPVGYRVVTPLTTLVLALMEATGEGPEQAENDLLSVLGLPPDVDLTNFDPIAASLSNDAILRDKGEAAAAVATQIQNTIVQASSLLTGASATSFSVAMNAVISELALQIGARAEVGGSLQLSDPDAIVTILENAGLEFGANVTTVAITAVGAANVIAASNQLVEEASSTGATGVAFLTALAQTSAVAQGSAAQALLDAGEDGTTSAISTVEANFTGSNLGTAISNATVGNVVGGNGSLTNLTLTELADTLLPSPSNATLVATSLTLNSGDQLDGGDGHDVLALFGGGTFRLDEVSQFEGFEEVQLKYVNGSGPSEVYLRNGADVYVSSEGGGGAALYFGSGAATSVSMAQSSGGTYHFSDGSATVIGSSGSFESYLFSSGTATVYGRGEFVLSSGDATVFAVGGTNGYYLGDGDYALHGADGKDEFSFTSSSQLANGATLLDGGDGSNDALLLGGQNQVYDLTAAGRASSRTSNVSLSIRPTF